SAALTVDLSEAGFSRLSALGRGRIPVWIEAVTAADGAQDDRDVALEKPPEVLSGSTEGGSGAPPDGPADPPSALLPTTGLLAAGSGAGVAAAAFPAAPAAFPGPDALLARYASGRHMLRPLAI